MRRKDPQKIGEVLREYVKRMRMEARLREAGIANEWEQIVGKMIADATAEIYVRDRKLHVKLYSSTVRNQLFMMRDQLRDKVNEHLGSPVIDEVVLK